MNSPPSMTFAILFSLALPSELAHAQDEPARLTVSPNEAQLEVVISFQTHWGWNDPSTEANATEYEWAVEWAVADTTYALGFYLFKSPGARPATGHLDALLASGQVSVWVAVAGSPAAALPGTGFRIERRDDRLLIRLRDPQIVQRVFAPRPETVQLIQRRLGEVVQRPLSVRYVRS